MGSSEVKSLHICYWCVVVGRHVSKHLDSSVWESLFRGPLKNNILKKCLKQAALSLASLHLGSSHSPDQPSTHDRYEIPTVQKSRCIKTFPRRIRLAVARSNKLPKHSNSSETKYHIRPALAREGCCFLADGLEPKLTIGRPALKLGLNSATIFHHPMIPFYLFAGEGSFLKTWWKQSG